jgi:hypothetical protein
VAHYSADLSAGKEAECYYHHFGMPLPKSLQDKIAQPKTAQPEAESTPSGDPVPEKKTDLRLKGEAHSASSRAGLHPDICAECWRNGHSCRAHCTVENERLCLDCADGVPCPIAREKAASTRTPVHERYHVKLPGQNPPKPANVSAPRTLPIPPQPRKPANISLVLDDKGLPTRAVSTQMPVPVVANIQVPTAGKDRQEEERTTMKPTDGDIPRYCAHEGCTKTLTRANKSGYCTKHFYYSKKNGAAPAPRSKATPPRNSTSKVGAPESGAATLHVTETHLNNFLLKLSLDEKTAIVQRHLEGA